MVYLFCPLKERGDSDSDAELWKREEIAGLDHKMLWFKGKNWTEKKTSFCPIILAGFKDARGNA